MHEGDARAFAGIFLVSVGFGSFLGFCLGVHFTGIELRKEAVKNKVAHWTVDENGCVGFEWNSPMETK